MRNEVFAFLDGRSYTRNGISGHFKHDISYAIYPYLHGRERLLFYPDAHGRQTVEYQETKKFLGDDWVSDITDDIEHYCEIAMKLGFVLAPLEESVS